jgi:ATP-dependent exoDNAse (exonuclease V) beta subunit
MTESHLPEAGTGKTWTLAALYQYLVRGQGEDETAYGQPPTSPEVLMATFTEILTFELSERLRQRLLEVGRCVRDEQLADGEDRFLLALMRSFPAGPHRTMDGYRLIVAGEGINDVCEHAIGVWIRRMLREHPCYGSSLFDSSRGADEWTLLLELMRKRVHPMLAILLEQVLDLWKATVALRRDLARLIRPVIEVLMTPETLVELVDDLHRELEALQHTPENLKKLREAKRPKIKIQDLPIHTMGKLLGPEDFEQWFDSLPTVESSELMPEPCEWDTPLQIPARRDPPSIQHEFPSWQRDNDFLHDLCTGLARHGFAVDQDATLCARLLERLENSGRWLEQEIPKLLRRMCTEGPDYRKKAEAMLDWLIFVGTTPLPGPGVALDQLHTARAEMEFWLPIEHIHSVVLDQLCRYHLLPGLDRPALQSSDVHGMLTGCADLVFEHAGRYWVLEFKSDKLGPDDQAYGTEAIAQYVARHRHDVQAALHLGALHRLLASRLGESYDPQQHLGGAVLLFVRGIEHPGCGACVLQPGTDFYHRLDALLDNEEVCA